MRNKYIVVTTFTQHVTASTLEAATEKARAAIIDRSHQLGEDEVFEECTDCRGQGALAGGRKCQRCKGDGKTAARF